MKLPILLGALLFASTLLADDEIQVRFEEMAKTYSHFSVTVVVYNGPLHLKTMEATEPGTNAPSLQVQRINPLAVKQLQLVKDLRALSSNEKILMDLLKNPNPKVRTLALGAIFEREDGRDLPLIATLINDSAPTFPNLHESMNSRPGPSQMAELENPQSVGDVAQAMLAFWGVPHRDFRLGITINDFNEYWKQYAGRNYSASWFAVKLKRATRQTTPIQPEYRQDIQRVFAEMQALPMPDRVWTQLYVLAPASWFQFDSLDQFPTDSEMVAMAKQLDPVSLLRFLEGKPVSDDPDLRMNGRVANFILRHADQLLRPTDAEALLACENAERGDSGVNPAWAIGAALLQPARANEILRAALARETRGDETAAGKLAGALWRIRGPAEKDFLVNWFYTVSSVTAMPISQTQAFLWEVERVARPDTKQLIIALVKDSRFDYTDRETLKETLKIVNASRSTPLVSEQDIYDARTGDLVDQRLVLATWRNLLKREYGFSEKPLPSPEAKPKQVLTQPAWSVPLASAPSLIVPSPNGKWLALLTTGTVTIWKADTGELWWQIPHDTSIAGVLSDHASMAFEPDEERLMVFDLAQWGRFSEWNIATRQPIGTVPLTGKPTSGVDHGAYCFDHAVLHAVFSGYNDLACFDIRSGKALWLHEHEGGVRSVIALSSNGTRLAVGVGAVVRLYDVLSGARLRQFDQHTSPVLALALSSDGRNLVTASTADGLQLWNTATGKLLKEYAHQVPNWGMSAPVFSPDEKRLAILGTYARIGKNWVNRIRILQVNSGELEWEIQSKRTNQSIPEPLTFAPDGKILYTGAQQLEAWSLK